MRFHKIFVDMNGGEGICRFSPVTKLFYNDTIVFLYRENDNEKVIHLCFQQGVAVIVCTMETIMNHVECIVSTKTYCDYIVHYNAEVDEYMYYENYKGRKSTEPLKNINLYIDFPNEIKIKEKRLTKFQRAMDIEASRHEYLAQREEFKKSLRSHSSGTEYSGKSSVKKMCNRQKKCLAITTKKKQCVNKVLKGTNYCGIPSHKKNANK